MTNSIQDVAARIRSWISLGEPGIIWIRYLSVVSRDSTLTLLDGLPSRVDFDPPDPVQAGEWLECELRKHVRDSQPATVAVLFPPRSNSDQPKLWEAFQSLNLRRERIAGLPLIQLWWIPIDLSPRAELEAPDLASWFQLKLWLEELPSAIPRDRDSGTILGMPKEDTEQREFEVAAARKAVAHYRQLAASRPEAFLPQLATSLRAFARMAKDSGRIDEAFQAIDEALRTHRQLAGERPDAFLSDLAETLEARGELQASVCRWQEAAASYAEAVRLLAPGLEVPPESHTSLVARLRRRYFQSAQAAHLEPDSSLLTPEAAAQK